MGREIRRVPANWDHKAWSATVRDDGQEQSCYDENYQTARDRWLADFAAHKPEDHDGEDFWEYSGPPPERAYYRPWKDEDATWSQLWQTVSEGTPVSPPFATLDELATYLAANGDFWDQKRGHSGWGRARAYAFCKSGWSPSFAVFNGQMLESKDIPLALQTAD